MAQVDYTKFRKGSKPNGRPIGYCPKCGRKGEVTFYDKEGWGTVVHSGVTSALFFHVRESCHITERPK